MVKKHYQIGFFVKSTQLKIANKLNLGRKEIINVPYGFQEGGKRTIHNIGNITKERITNYNERKHGKPKGD